MQSESQSSQQTNIPLRLQQIIANWGGPRRGEPLSDLHSQCLDVAGRGSKFLPAQLLFVADLDLTHLRTAIRQSASIGRHISVEFLVAPAGRFDAALVPVGRVGTLPDRFILALDQSLTLQEQVALYGHAVGHLLLNYQEEQMGQRPQLDPRNAFAHADTLAELRLLEAVKQPLDRRVLETFPLLTRLLETPEESRADFDTATLGLRELLTRAGWAWPYADLRYQLTAGRVYPSSSRRGTRLYVDALLRASASLPIAVVHALRPGETYDDAVRRVQGYVRRLAIPFAYLLDEQGCVHEFDWSAASEPVHCVVDALPEREVLQDRWFATLQLSNPRYQRALLYPYRYSGTRRPRYYQEAAINRAVVAVLQALQGSSGRSRILLTLATGTGKTQVAFQLLWKLKRERVVRNVLFLTDRDFLLTQAMD